MVVIYPHLEKHYGPDATQAGGIWFKGEDITGQEPYLLARKGMDYVPDDRRIFADLTVGENLEIAARSNEPFDYAQDKTRFARWDEERVYELFPALKERVPQGWLPQRRRAEDAGHCQGTDGQPRTLAPGRAH